MQWGVWSLVLVFVQRLTEFWKVLHPGGVLEGQHTRHLGDDPIEVSGLHQRPGMCSSCLNALRAHASLPPPPACLTAVNFNNSSDQFWLTMQQEATMASAQHMTRRRALGQEQASPAATQAVQILPQATPL